MEFTKGVPPNEAGHYWLRLTTSDSYPVKYSIGVYAWKCRCHPSSLQGLEPRQEYNLASGIMTVTGWIRLPDPKH